MLTKVLLSSPASQVGPIDRDVFPASGGNYILWCECREAREIGVGARGMLHLQPGWYAYAGSAFGPGGLRARLARHLRGGSKRHWHIDYLRPHAPIYEIWYSPKTQNCEHRWAAALGHITGAQIPLPGFGSSDCRCAAHLFFFAASADAWKRIETDAWKRIETDAWKRIETDAWKRIESDSW